MVGTSRSGFPFSLWSVVIDVVDVIAEYGCSELLDSKLSRELKSEFGNRCSVLPDSEAFQS